MDQQVIFLEHLYFHPLAAVIQHSHLTTLQLSQAQLVLLRQLGKRVKSTDLHF
jgi:hypothetical protein